MIAVSDNALAHNLLEPEAGGGIAAGGIIQMPSVPGEIVSEIGTAGILYGIHTVHKEFELRMGGKYLLRGRAYHLIHQFLVIIVIAKLDSGVAAFRSPRSVIDQSGIRTLLLEDSEQIGQGRFHRMAHRTEAGVVKAVIAGTFLNTDKGPVFICKSR